MDALSTVDSDNTRLLDKASLRDEQAIASVATHMMDHVEKTIALLLATVHDNIVTKCGVERDTVVMILRNNWNKLLRDTMDTAYTQNIYRLGQLFDTLQLKQSDIKDYYKALTNALRAYIEQELASGLWIPSQSRRSISIANRAMSNLLLIDMPQTLYAFTDYSESQKIQLIDNTIDKFDHAMTVLFSELIGKDNVSPDTPHKAGLSSSAQIAAHNVNAVAAAAQELSHSIQEINGQVQVSGGIVQDVVTKSETTSEILKRLQDNASKINDVTVFITHIAEQTSLLSLNATIEAARAGEAGRGFGVVATEVKTLAHQTAQATSEITDQVKNVQSAIADTVDAIKGIATTIDKMNSVTSTVTTAVTDQTVAMNEITKSIQFAADSANQVTGIAQQMTERLRTQLDLFLSELKARI